jgi:16S rRNA (cytosine967-C5)-methyltransferase
MNKPIDHSEEDKAREQSAHGPQSAETPAGKRDFSPRGADQKPSGPRPSSSFHPTQSGRPAFGQRSGYGKRPGERPAYGHRPAAGGHPSDSRPAFGEKSSSSGNGPSANRPSFGNRPASGGRPAFGNRPASGERPAFGNRPASGGRPAFGNRPATGGRPAYGKRPAPGKRPDAQTRPAQIQQPQGPNAREAALHAFSAVLHKDAYASQAINEQLKSAGFSQVDKRLCTSIVYRTLENLIAIDFALSGFLKEPDTMEPRVRDILRISACQFLFMDKIPENALVDEAVKLTRAIGLEALTGLVNGVLRSLIRGRDEIKGPDESEGARYLSIRYSMPQWLVERLIEAYGPELAAQIVRYRTEEHFMTLRPNLMRESDAQFEELLGKKVWKEEKGLVPHAWRVREVSQVACDEDYLSGNFSIQGEASILCAQIADVKRGMQVLDCCAAPGGKTAYMAETMAGTGRVYAWDLHEHRVTLLKAMTHRLKLDNVRPAVRDARVVKEDLAGMIDTVLLDAPCSGLGVMDDKPDIKYRVTPESIAELVNTQRELLEACCTYVKAGGTLVYSTCSILPEENEKQIERFLKDHPEFTLDKFPSSVDTRFTEKAGPFGLQLLECRDGVEGFFIARLKRVRY